MPRRLPGALAHVLKQMFAPNHLLWCQCAGYPHLIVLLALLFSAQFSTAACETRCASMHESTSHANEPSQRLAELHSSCHRMGMSPAPGLCAAEPGGRCMPPLWADDLPTQLTPQSSAVSPHGIVIAPIRSEFTWMQTTQRALQGRSAARHPCSATIALPMRL